MAGSYPDRVGGAARSWSHDPCCLPLLISAFLGKQGRDQTHQSVKSGLGEPWDGPQPKGNFSCPSTKNSLQLIRELPSRWICSWMARKDCELLKGIYSSGPGTVLQGMPHPLLYRWNLFCKVKQQVQKISHSRCPADHPEPLRSCEKEEIVRVRSSLLGVRNTGKGKASLVIALLKMVRKHLLYEGRSFIFYQGKGNIMLQDNTQFLWI